MMGIPTGRSNLASSKYGYALCIHVFEDTDGEDPGFVIDMSYIVEQQISLDYMIPLCFSGTFAERIELALIYPSICTKIHSSIFSACNKAVVCRWLRMMKKLIFVNEVYT